MASRTRRPASPALTGTALVETLLGGWRALSRLEVDGFAVLRSRGVTRRANSVVPLEPSSDPAAPDAAVTRIEGLLGAAGERPVFRLFTGEGLDHEAEIRFPERPEFRHGDEGGRVVGAQSRQAAQ